MTITGVLDVTRPPLLALPLLPLVGAALVVVLRRRPAASAWAAVATMLLTTWAALWSAAALPALDWAWGPRLQLSVAVVGLGRLMVVLVPAIATPVLLFAASDALAARGEHARGLRGQARLLALLSAFVGAMELLVLANDLLTLLVAWELVGACSWALIGHEWRDAERPRGARDAFLTTRAGDLGLYLATAATFTATGSLRFGALAALHGPALHVVAGGLLLAAAAKSAQIPFSPWLFRAMLGPTPASALLHSATMVAAGAYALARLTPLLSGATWLAPAIAALGLATALAGGIVATLQTDLKKALAASTSAQYGLMFVAIGAGVPAAAGLHLVTHAAFKALLFLGAGVVLHATGTLELGAIRLRRALPRVAIFFAAGVLALAAVPPLGGAYSKEQIVAAAGQMSGWLVAGVIVAGSLSALYASRLWLVGFGPDAPTSRAPHAEHTDSRAARSDPARRAASRPTTVELASLAVLAAVTIALSVLWLPGVGARLASIALGTLAHGTALETGLSLVGVAGGLGTSWYLWRRGRLLTLAVSVPVQRRLAAWLGIPTAAQLLVVRPVLALARVLAAADERVIDAGIRATARVGRFASSALGLWGERGIDGLVTALARATAETARASQVADDRGVDVAIEDVARGVGVLGTRSRLLQSGLAHQYYLVVAAGLVVLVAAAVVGYVMGNAASPLAGSR